MKKFRAFWRQTFIFKAFQIFRHKAWNYFIKIYENLQGEYPIFPAVVFEGFACVLRQNVTSKTPVFLT